MELQGIFPSLPALKLLNRYQLPLAPFTHSQSPNRSFCAKKKIYEKSVDEADRRVSVVEVTVMRRLECNLTTGFYLDCKNAYYR